jgi:predicted RNase H-like nuclease
VEALGLDACRGKWLAVVLDGNGFVGAHIHADAAALISHWPDVVGIGVDIPIGLPEEPGREADRAAREFVGARRSSVFPTFPREVLTSPTYEDAKRLSFANGWPMPSLQSYGMRRRILEIDTLARQDERIIEVHPEVSFRELFGQPLAAKRTVAGVSERRSALAAAGIEMPELPYPIDDVLDAAVVAWTARRYAGGEALPLPSHQSSRIGPIWR